METKELEKVAQRLNFAWTGEQKQWQEIMKNHSKGYSESYNRWIGLAKAAFNIH